MKTRCSASGCQRTFLVYEVLCFALASLIGGQGCLFGQQGDPKRLLDFSEGQMGFLDQFALKEENSENIRRTKKKKKKRLFGLVRAFSPDVMLRVPDGADALYARACSAAVQSVRVYVYEDYGACCCSLCAMSCVCACSCSTRTTRFFRRIFSFLNFQINYSCCCTRYHTHTRTTTYYY